MEDVVLKDWVTLHTVKKLDRLKVFPKQEIVICKVKFRHNPFSLAFMFFLRQNVRCLTWRFHLWQSAKDCRKANEAAKKNCRKFFQKLRLMTLDFQVWQSTAQR